MSMRRTLSGALMAAVAALVAIPASGQVLGGTPVGGVLGGLGGGAGPGGGISGPGGIGAGPVGGVLDSLGRVTSATDPLTQRSLERVVLPAERTGRAALNYVGANYVEGNAVEPASLLDLRRLRLDSLIRSNARVLDRDEHGQPVRRNVLIALDPAPTDLAVAARLGFTVAADTPEPQLGLRMVSLAVPGRLNVRKALAALRKAAPALQVDYDYVYEPAGGALAVANNARLASSAPLRSGTKIAMIDGGVASHPAMARAVIEQRGFAGSPQPTGHGTAVGSLLVGDQGPFHGAARGAQLYVADIYGGDPAAGSATVIVKALAWAASKRPAVISMSLVGPPNRVLARAVDALRARGIALVAAVGNDGPAAPPQFPASYDGVVAVTGVDGADRALREAGRATHLDYAAPGADLVAALPGGGYTPVRGTSFAAPLVAARIAATGSAAALASEALPGKGKVGRGIICRQCRISPQALRMK